MKIKNLEINKEKVFTFFTNVVCAAGVVAICICTQNIYKKVTKGLKESNNTKIEEQINDNSREVVLNGVTYIVPEGSRLEVIDDQVWEVRRTRLYSDLIEMKDKNGNIVHVAPIGYKVYENEAYCDADEFIEPTVKR